MGRTGQQFNIMCFNDRFMHMGYRFRSRSLTCGFIGTLSFSGRGGGGGGGGQDRARGRHLIFNQFGGRGGAVRFGSFNRWGGGGGGVACCPLSAGTTSAGGRGGGGVAVHFRPIQSVGCAHVC